MKYFFFLIYWAANCQIYDYQCPGEGFVNVNCQCVCPGQSSHSPVVLCDANPATKSPGGGVKPQHTTAAPISGKYINVLLSISGTLLGEMRRKHKKWKIIILNLSVNARFTVLKQPVVYGLPICNLVLLCD